MESTIRCSHILQKHNGSRRPFDSYRNKPVTRTIEEATANIQRIREDVVNKKATFAELAKTYSECGSAAKGGDLGEFGRGQMQQSFEDAAFKLKVGELSGLVSSDSGIHIILRTA